ncbi:hypothetical protein M5689_016165 [Euphorbia peplus]|nr:hypothetical protein M5689_016165 [Euphorbia peplus]
MELKHKHYTHHHHHLSLSSLPNLSLPSSIHCSRFKPWINTKISINKHLQGLQELWRFHVLQLLKPDIQTPNNKNHHSSHHHVTKGAQNLNSVLRQYGVSIDLIKAADKNTMDVDLLLKYQLLNTLNFAREPSQLIKKNAFSSVHRVGIGFHGNSEEKPLKMLTPHALPHGKSNGYFLVLVPLIVLICITCIVRAFSTRVPKDNGSKASDESTKHKHQPKSSRWRHALSYNSETDDVVSVLQSAPDDEDENLFENSYSKVETDYQKFLSECGISESGYQHRRSGTH